MSDFEEVVLSLFVSPEYFDAVLVGYGFAMAAVFIALVFAMLFLFGVEFLIPLLRRLFKLDESKV